MRYHPDATGTAPLVTQLAEDLAAAGERVEVVASLPHYGRKDVHPDFRGHRGLFHVAEDNGVKVWRTPVYVPPAPRVFHRALNYLSYTLLSLLAGVQAQKADVVLAINPPITTTFSAWLAALFHQAPLVVGIQDIWPDCVILVGQLKNRILIKLSYWMEKLQYRIAKRVIVLSRSMAENLLKKGVSEKKIAVIPNWADPDKVKPIPQTNSFRERYNLESQFIVLFAGNHGFNAALEKVLATAKLLSAHSEIVFLFVGEGNVKDELIFQAETEELGNVRFLPTQPEHVFPQMLAAADIGLVPLRGNLGDLNVPSKVYTLMAAARPVIASVPDDSEVATLVRKARCGFVIPPEDPQALAEAILDSMAESNHWDHKGKKGRQYLLSHFSRKTQVGNYHRLLQEVGLERN